jgi:hypothetical protein
MALSQLEQPMIHDSQSRPTPGVVEEAILLADEDADVGFEKIAFDHCLLAVIHSRKAEHFYRLAEQHRAAETEEEPALDLE